MESYLKQYIGKNLINHYKYDDFQYVQVNPFEMGGIQLPATYLGQPSPWLKNTGKDYLIQNKNHVDRFSVVMGNWPQDTVIGPFNFLAGGVGVAVFRAVFVDKKYNLTDASMGMPWRQDIADYLTKWPKGDPDGQFWGSIIVTLDFKNIFDGNDPDLSILSNSGYSYSLWRSGNASIPRIDIACILTKDVKGTSSACTKFKDLNEKKISVAFNILDGTWNIDVASNWTPIWYLPLMICLPFLSIIVGLVMWIVMILMLNSARYRNKIILLKSLIPVDVLEGRLGSTCINQNDPILALMPLETPAEKIINLLAELLRGETPSIDKVLAVREAMITDEIHRIPIGLEAALIKHFDRDVVASILALVDSPPQLKLSTPQFRSKASLFEPCNIPLEDAIGDSNVQMVLKEACTNWYFDILDLHVVTNGHALSSLAFYLLTRNTDVANALHLNLVHLANFLSAIETQYSSTAQYHNAIHGADVLQSFALMCNHVLIPRGYVDTQLVHLACIIAAVVHDVDHKGVNNDFLINSRDPLALQYNDLSPMESYHCYVAFKTLYQKDCDFISHFSDADQKVFRHLVIQLVMATDMKQHFTILSKFCAKHRLGKCPDPDITDSGLLMVVNVPSIDGPPPLDDAEKLLSLQMALKMSDIRATSMPMPIAEKWVMWLQEEFFSQGDRELELGLQISPLSDRNASEGISKSQTGFYEFIILPMVYNMLYVFPEIRDGPLNGFRRNYLELTAKAEAKL